MAGYGYGGGYARRRRAAKAPAEQIIARMSPAPDASRQALIRDFVKALNAGGVWGKLDTLFVLAAHAEQAATLDWARGGISATFTGAPVFVADRGYTTESSTAYINTGYSGLTQRRSYAQDSAHLAAWSRTAAASASTVAADTGVSTYASLGFRTSNGNTLFRINAASNSSIANADGSGLFFANRVSATHAQLYRNGAQLGADVAIASIAPTSAAMRIGNGGSSGQSRQYALQGAGRGLTAGEATAYYNAALAYMTGVGAA